MRNVLLALLLAAGVLFTGCTPTSDRYIGSSRTEEEEIKNRYDLVVDPQKDSPSINDQGVLEEEEEPYDYPEGYEEKAYEKGMVFEPLLSDESSMDADRATQREKFIMTIIKYLDTPYQYGGNSIKGIDCSAFTLNVFSESMGTRLLRSAREQFTQGQVITSREDLGFGDLVFFNTRRGAYPGHVGIYLYGDYFVHASTKKGVIVSSLVENYYNSRYIGARRISEVYDFLTNKSE